jgi:hypothetical protein
MRFTALPALVFAVVAAPALAVPLQLTRDTLTVVDTGAAGTFAGAQFSYSNNIGFDTGTGTLNTNLLTVPASTGISIYGLGSSVATPSSTPDGTPSTPVSVTSDGSAGSGWGFSYAGAASSVAGNSFLTNTTFGTRYALDFSGGGTNFVDLGGRFTSTVKILGDFSAASAHTAVSFGAGYALLQDFVFDAINNLTLVQVETTQYDGTNPGIHFLLLGDELRAHVPEPSMPFLMALALLALASMRMRRARL